MLGWKLIDPVSFRPSSTDEHPQIITGSQNIGNVATPLSTEIQPKRIRLRADRLRQGEHWLNLCERGSGRVRGPARMEEERCQGRSAVEGPTRVTVSKIYVRTETGRGQHDHQAGTSWVGRSISSQ